MLIALFIYLHVLHPTSHTAQQLQPAVNYQQLQPQSNNLQVTTGGYRLQHTVQGYQLQGGL